MAAEASEAAKKMIRHPLPVACTIDPEVPAVFYCSRCKKPFCEDCIGRESGNITLCLECAGVEESIEEEVRHRSVSTPARKKHLIFTILATIACLAIAANGYILYTNQLESEPANAPDQTLSPQLQGIVDCRADLEALAAEAAIYRQIMGHPPASLEQLKLILDPRIRTEDPVSHAAYIIESDPAGNITVRCPTPEEHGVASITAVPGKPARITYLTAAEQP